MRVELREAANIDDVSDDAERLMERVRARDAVAFEQLYDEHHRIVWSIAMRVLGEREAAEDVTQAVFMKLWNAPERFIGGNFPGWLARVTRNRALDALRSRSLRSTEELPAALPEDERLEDLAFARLDAAQVRRALATLPPEQRSAIELGFFGGLTHEAIAERTGDPLGTVKTRIRSGLRKLRAALDGKIER
uniref:Putative RNA polymerase sigma factor n=1 Tax=mine drainage metagenome TaxID=410659 RepID=E6Q2X1_9ZZZZ